jgi:branched-chain amino acid transport system permease protein
MSGDTDTESVSDRVSDGVLPQGLPLRYVFGFLGLVALALVPVLGMLEIGIGVPGVFVLVFDDLLLLDLTSAFYFAMFAMSWDVVSGYTGQISFGHGLFFAVGGYSSALLNLGYGVDPLLSIPIGIVLAAVAGIVIGVPALRLRGPYLSLVTLVAPLILLQVFIWQSGIFGGEIGLPQPENVFGLGTGDTTLVYYLAFGLFVAIMALLLAVTRSDAGRVFTAIREDEDAVAAAGLNPAKFKIFAFVLSAAIGGLAGGMYVHAPVGGATPAELMTTQVNVEVIIAAVLGGMGTIVGAAIGGMFVYLFPEMLSGVDFVVPLLNTQIADIEFLLFSLVTLVLLMVLPGGILRAALRTARGVRDRSSGDSEELATDGGRADADVTPLEQVYDRYRDAIRGDDDEH